MLQMRVSHLNFMQMLLHLPADAGAGLSAYHGHHPPVLQGICQQEECPGGAAEQNQTKLPG